jgi:hypothetical protein
MLAVKVIMDKRNRDELFSKGLSKVITFVKKSFKNELSIINDNSCVEIVSGNTSVGNGEIQVELTIKKTIFVKKENFEQNIINEIESFYKDKV